jgi:hypothetical protein
MNRPRQPWAEPVKRLFAGAMTDGVAVCPSMTRTNGTDATAGKNHGSRRPRLPEACPSGPPAPSFPAQGILSPISRNPPPAILFQEMLPSLAAYVTRRTDRFHPHFESCLAIVVWSTCQIPSRRALSSDLMPFLDDSIVGLHATPPQGWCLQKDGLANPPVAIAPSSVG